MKLFLVIFSVFIVGVVCEPVEDKSEDELELTMSKISNRLPPPALYTIQAYISFSGNTSADIDEKCPNSSGSFKKAIEFAMECGDATDPGLSVCSAVKTRFMTCLAPLINVTENCMPQKSKGVPTLITKSIVSIISYICGLNGEQIFEFFNDCMMEPIKKQDDKFDTKELDSKMKKIIEDLTVKNICSIGPEIKTLIKEFLQKTCSNKMTQDVYVGFIDAVLKPCTTINEL